MKSNAVNFDLFLEGVCQLANFKLIFLSHFSTNFERFGAYPAAFEMNFPIHTNFSLSGGFQSSNGHVFLDHPFF